MLVKEEKRRLAYSLQLVNAQCNCRDEEQAIPKSKCEPLLQSHYVAVQPYWVFEMLANVCLISSEILLQYWRWAGSFYTSAVGATCLHTLDLSSLFFETHGGSLQFVVYSGTSRRNMNSATESSFVSRPDSASYLAQWYCRYVSCFWTYSRWPASSRLVAWCVKRFFAANGHIWRPLPLTVSYSCSAQWHQSLLGRSCYLILQAGYFTKQTLGNSPMLLSGKTSHGTVSRSLLTL